MKFHPQTQVLFLSLKETCIMVEFASDERVDTSVASSQIWEVDTKETINSNSLQVTGAEMSVLETVLRCDTERTELLQEEARLLAVMNPAEPPQNGTLEKADVGVKDKSGGKMKAAPPVSDPEASSKLEKASHSFLLCGFSLASLILVLLIKSAYVW